MQKLKHAAQLALHLTTHPADLPRLPAWLPVRDTSPMTLRRPFWPYKAVAWVEAHLPAAPQVYEYGGGGSSLWLLDHGAHLTVVEHDPIWAAQLEAEKVTVVLRPPQGTGSVRSDVVNGFFDDYAAAIDSEPNDCFDLVIVDGRARVDCVFHAMQKVKPGGMLLLDDTERARYKPAVVALAGWQLHVFSGIKPGGPPAQTSVWRRPVSSP